VVQVSLVFLAVLGALLLLVVILDTILQSLRLVLMHLEMFLQQVGQEEVVVQVDLVVQVVRALLE
jgi:hypothetical protein